MSLEQAERGIDKVVFSTGEQVAIQEAIIQNLSQPSTPSYGFYPPITYTPITEEKLLSELAEREEFSESRGGYVGLSHFVKVHLGYQDYDYATSYDVINDLAKRGIIEVYDTTSLLGYPTRAIRRIGYRDNNVTVPTGEDQPEEAELETDSEANAG